MRPSSRSCAGPDLQGLDIVEYPRVECRLGVQPKQAKANGAQVHAVDRPVADPLGPERATVADSMIEDTPGIGELIAVFPGRPGDLAIGVGVRLPDAERLPACPQ